MGQEGKQQRRHSTSDRYTAFDRDLISAKQEGKEVRIEFLGIKDRFITARVISVDRYFLKVEEPATGIIGWLNKAWIASIEVSR